MVQLYSRILENYKNWEDGIFPCNNADLSSLDIVRHVCIPNKDKEKLEFLKS